jgi:hypothetical protein
VNGEAIISVKSVLAALDGALDEVTRLRDLCGWGTTEPVGPLYDRLKRAEAEVARLRETLAAVEWVDAVSTEGVLCPWCLSWREHGHALECVRQVALRSPGEEQS